MENLIQDETISTYPPYSYEDSVTIVFLAGVHGVGKTTIATELASKLYQQGIDIYYLPERNYAPKGLIAQTEEFQRWYDKEMEYRVSSIKGLINPVSAFRPQILVVDRTATDVDCYTAKEDYADGTVVVEIANKLVYELRNYLEGFELYPHYNVNILCYNVTRPLDEVMTNLSERMEIQEFRKNWNETDETAWMKIRTMFFNVWARAGMLVRDLQDEKIYISTLNNKSVDLSVEEIMFDLEGTV